MHQARDDPRTGLILVGFSAPQPLAARGHRLARPVEDTRQLGGDAIMIDGIVRQLWRPRSPDDRPAAAEVIAATRAWPS